MAIINSYEAFSKHFTEVFGLATGVLFVSDQLLRLHQGTSSTDEYTLQFCTLAATSGWNEVALLSACRQALEPRIRAQMAIFDDSVGLESFTQRPTGFPSTYQPATHPKPLTILSHGLSLRNACRLAAGLCL